jgi:Repeat of unknown function (DUF5650)
MQVTANKPTLNRGKNGPDFFGSIALIWPEIRRYQRARQPLYSADVPRIYSITPNPNAQYVRWRYGLLLLAAGVRRRMTKILGRGLVMPQFLRILGTRSRPRLLGWVGISALAVALPVRAAQIDIPGPLGSVAFGTSVTVLPNGNFVVTDPSGPVSAIGAVYLYSPTGTLISTLTGSSTNDQVGSNGVVVVGGGNFVVRSPSWNKVGASGAGAVTWVNGSTGLSGVVTVSNSLVGTTTSDTVGNGGVTVLSNGNYVVDSDNWNNGVAGSNFGAATWGNANNGITGPVSASNSLIGTTAGDSVGSYGVTALSNGNYVVASDNWNNGGASGAGAVTWVNGSTGLSGVVSVSNSLIGTTANDFVGYGVTALSNGNYVVASPSWNNGVAGHHFGAVTWGNGSSGIAGAVSASNSLIGTTANDYVGFAIVTALSNGNYVVASVGWNNGVAGSQVGAATWGNGSSGIAGPVSASNSLIGTTAGDTVGSRGVTALSNGNYVVDSVFWNNGVAGNHFGAATWGNGSSGIAGPVSASNSLIGTTAGDGVGYGVTALSNGNYVVASPSWNNGVANSSVGAAAWGNGSSGITGPVSASNSLIGTTANDGVGYGVTALSNGNYVVASHNWNNGVTGSNFGAATWGNGSSGITGPVSASNSLIGTTAGDFVSSSGVTALSNGNYVVASDNWNNGGASGAGAVTWVNGSTGLSGVVSVSNSLIGTTANDFVGINNITALSNGNYVVDSGYWSHLGAVTLANGGFRLKGTIQSWNSVIGTVANGGLSMAYAYDPTRQELIVGRPASNIVSVFTMDQIFADDFAP